MAIRIDCPRCKASLQVPNDLAGGYIHCPHCKGRMWVSKDSPTDATAIGSIAITESDKTVVATKAMPPSSPIPPIRTIQPAFSPAPSRPRKKVARFITADAADSSLRLAPDGKLPKLHLDEGRQHQRSDGSVKPVHPLLLLGILSISIILSVSLVFLGGDSSASSSRIKAIMRQKIENSYFGLGNLESEDLKPYQLELREARQAYSRGDYKAEQVHCRKVLNLLRAERGMEDHGLTGSRTKDKELEEALTILLSG